MSTTATGNKAIDQIWHEKAACRGPSQTIFYPPTRLERRPDKRRREQRAKEICASCPVRFECLTHAINIREQHGIWGGLTERERRLIAAKGGDLELHLEAMAS